MTYNLPLGVYQETYNSVSFLFPFSLTGATIEMIIYTPGKSVVIIYTLGNAISTMYTIADNLEIDANENKRLRIKTHEMAIQPGNYIYKIKITKDNVKKTYLTGNWSITE
jgi:hypothetical protein